MSNIGFQEILMGVFVLVFASAGIALILGGPAGFRGAARGAGRDVGAAFRGIGHGIRWVWNHQRIVAGVMLFVALNGLFIVFPALWKGLVGQGWVAVLLIELLFVAVAIGSWSGRNAGHVTAMVTAAIAAVALIAVGAAQPRSGGTIPPTAMAPAPATTSVARATTPTPPTQEWVEAYPDRWSEPIRYTPGINLASPDDGDMEVCMIASRDGGNACYFVRNGESIKKPDPPPGLDTIRVKTQLTGRVFITR